MGRLLSISDLDRERGYDSQELALPIGVDEILTALSDRTSTLRGVE